MKNYQLKQHKTQNILFSGNFHSFLDCLEEAVRMGTNLSGIDLRHKNLTNGNLDGANMPKAMLTRANLTGANLSEACMQGSILHQTSLFNTCFCYSDLRSCDFQSASFGATDIAGADISFSTFSTLSCFDLDFWHTAKMDGCIYMNVNGKISTMTHTPVVIKGLTDTPMIVLDDDIHIGQDIILKQNFQNLILLLEARKSISEKRFFEQRNLIHDLQTANKS